MNWLGRFGVGKPALTPGQARRLAVWRSLPAASCRAGLDAARFVVMDVETSGLNLARDRLIAIGAVAVRGGRISLGDSFEVVLQQQHISDRDNILVHGIGAGAQRNGMPPADALLAFLEYLGKDPLVAFHVTFDQTMIVRAMKRFLGMNFKHAWLDLAYAVPALYPEQARDFRSLDQWQDHFHISNPARHNALADALSTAQLFQFAISAARRQHAPSYRDLQDLAQARRWVSWEG